jgi:hypothetical protein
MANMSYCRFQNTYIDLRDCFDNMGSNDLSEREFRYRNLMIEMCIEIAKGCEDLLDEEFVNEYNEDNDE